VLETRNTIAETGEAVGTLWNISGILKLILSPSALYNLLPGKYYNPGLLYCNKLKKTKLRGLASELYRPSYRRLSAKLVATFLDTGCDVVSVTNPYGRILGFLDLSCYFFFQVAPQLYSRGWVNPVRDSHFSENLVVPGIKPGPMYL
jgi:hypothetical protein